jgi:hypothetical protein
MPTVLLVSSDGAIRQTATGHLGAKGYDVVGALSATEGRPGALWPAQPHRGCPHLRYGGGRHVGRGLLPPTARGLLFGRCVHAVPRAPVLSVAAPLSPSENRTRRTGEQAPSTSPTSSGVSDGCRVLRRWTGARSFFWAGIASRRRRRRLSFLDFCRTADYSRIASGSSSVAEPLPSKQVVAGSIPVSRSMAHQTL